MARKKSTVARFVKLVASGKKKSAPRDNPKKSSVFDALPLPVADVGAGVLAFSSTKLLSKIVDQRLRAKAAKWGGWANYSPPVTSTVTLLALWYLSSKWKRAKDRQYAILIGASLAVVQEIVRTFLPGLGWLVGLPGPAMGPKPLPGETATPVYPEGQEPQATGADAMEPAYDEDEDLRTGIFMPGAGAN